MRLGTVTSGTMLVSLLVLLSVITYFQRTSMSIAGPGIAREFGLTETQLGSVYSAFLLGYTLLMIPGGWLADRLGPRRTVTMVALFTAVFTTATALAGTGLTGGAPAALTLLLLIRFALGVSTAPIYPAAARMNSNWMPIHKRALVQGWIAAGAAIGGALSPYVLPFVVVHWGWRSAFVATGVTTLAVALVWLAVARDYPRSSMKAQTEGQESGSWLKLIAKRQLLLITSSYLATSYFLYIFFYWTYYYLGEIRRASASQSAMFTTLLFLAWMVLSPLGGRISDILLRRLGPIVGPRVVPVSALIASALMTIVAINLTSVVATGGLLALALGLAAATDASFWAAAIAVGGKQAGSAGGILNTGGNLGGLLAPVMTPWIATHYGWSAGLYFGCAVVVVGAVLWFKIDTTSDA
jgi:MFS family permease